jgi:hypothetical protein
MCREAGVSGTWFEGRVRMHVELESIGECGLSP